MMKSNTWRALMRAGFRGRSVTFQRAGLIDGSGECPELSLGSGASIGSEEVREPLSVDEGPFSARRLVFIALN